MSKINQKTLTESATTAVGAVAAAMVSPVAAYKLSGVLKKPPSPHAALAIAGLALAAFVNPKETSGNSYKVLVQVWQLPNSPKYSKAYSPRKMNR
nr:hypothetical protein [Campylobacter concisus]